MEDRFEKLKKIAMEEFGVKIKPSDQIMTFESLFGMDASDLPKEDTIFEVEEPYAEEALYTEVQCFGAKQCLFMDMAAEEYICFVDISASIAA